MFIPNLRGTIIGEQMAGERMSVPNVRGTTNPKSFLICGEQSFGEQMFVINLWGTNVRF